MPHGPLRKSKKDIARLIEEMREERELELTGQNTKARLQALELMEKQARPGTKAEGLKKDRLVQGLVANSPLRKRTNRTY